MPTYRAYDLTIRSDLDLPELETVDAEPDATITLGKVSPVPVPIDAEGSGFWATTDEACYFLEDVGGFLIREGREVIVDPAPGAEPGRVRLSILGPVLGVLLHQRGHLVLHASSVEVNGRAVAFAAARGWGKSTLAANLHARGHGVLSDDVTAIALGADGPRVLAGFPQVKLWPDAAEALGCSSEAQPRFHPRLDKRGFRVSRKSPQGSVPLDRVYVLSDGPAPGVEPLRPSEALVELIRHWYGARFGDRLLKTGTGAETHFRQFATLASSITVRRLICAGEASPVRTQIGLVEADLKS
jgi:hypothetical protein